MTDWMNPSFHKEGRHEGEGMATGGQMVGYTARTHHSASNLARLRLC